ncbi:MAG: bifunctional [glutamine synthetase] adenylyltransferase/[glutamine synthetase]-adenylyl-L-tyrosine phosphorylase [Alphaproteobacteria bacterium]|nr:bifunctional [glutamine synthetase] adenylyltransferase/[glutamine synthetase]-adenylyl-L-tyrosine phosphorylase [Alphaproteobacteria bacterium]
MHHAISAASITSNLPLASRDAEAAGCLEQLAQSPILAEALASAPMRALIRSAAGNAPFLARLMQKHPEQLARIGHEGFDGAWAAIVAQMRALNTADADAAAMMLALRSFKAQVALTTALSDLAGHWDLAQVTRALSDFAGEVVGLTLRHLLHRAAARGEFAPRDAQEPEVGSGIIILGMGKLGAYELNYSSDIDLMVLFDSTALPYRGGRNAQHFMNKIASDLTHILQERTSEGYVFRTDLRLRPDPMSTPLAVTTAAALTYYETVGQNWERAAMIKARPIAGDLPAATAYLRELVPFIWRKTLDFATIADIHSIKRQMNVKSGKTIELAGHNIKTGMGGIREIEFFVQTQQLVWGGRIPEIRVPGTLEGLRALTHYELVTQASCDTLTRAYQWLRKVEHRLQMRNDEQTHSLPGDEAGLHEVSLFSGYEATAPFAAACIETLKTVHRIYTESMMDSAPLAVDGNLVFTGVEADPDTLRTLAAMGYQETQRISDIIQGWHRGHRRSTRSKRSRQVLTELVPALLTALAKTANPDAAFFHFDDFIDRLPSGAQIFSLFLSRPEMLSLLADILGSAPALGDTLSNNPSLLDGVLEADFFLGLPSKEELENLVTERLQFAHAFEQKMIYLRSFNNEKRFQAGVHLLKRLATPKRVGAFLSDIAEIILQCTMIEVTAEYAAHTPAFHPVPFAVLALGKLGGREMTFGSDLDIVLIYDDGTEAASDARAHLTRISQRFISALTLLTREGRLYEVDTRLRPGGSDGPLAVSLAAFDAYFSNSAWTYEHMALTRARVVATNHPEFAARIEAVVRAHVLKPRDADSLLADVLDMRTRIAKQFPSHNPWALKHVRGGMVDLDFIAQYLVLRHAPSHPALWHRSARQVFETAQTLGVLDESTTAPLIAAKKFLSDLMSLLRLSAPGGLITDDAPIGLKRQLVQVMREEDFDALKQHVLDHEAEVSRIFARMAEGEL